MIGAVHPADSSTGQQMSGPALWNYLLSRRPDFIAWEADQRREKVRLREAQRLQEPPEQDLHQPAKKGEPKIANSTILVASFLLPHGWEHVTDDSLLLRPCSNIFLS